MEAMSTLRITGKIGDEPFWAKIGPEWTHGRKTNAGSPRVELCPWIIGFRAIRFQGHISGVARGLHNANKACRRTLAKLHATIDKEGIN